MFSTNKPILTLQCFINLFCNKAPFRKVINCDIYVGSNHLTSLTVTSIQIFFKSSFLPITGCIPSLFCNLFPNAKSHMTL